MWNELQRSIFAAECARAGAPPLAPMGLRMVGPVIMGFGTPEQKAHYLPRILSGEDYWCQGYSEPGAGSDLAALQLRAVSDGDDYVLSGSKIWTTHAQFANRMFCLVRTSTEGKLQAGITFLLLDMQTPGISVKPIITLAGEHEVNQVFFDAVRVPKSGRIGAENQGWTVAKHLLEFERGGGSAPRAPSGAGPRPDHRRRRGRRQPGLPPPAG
ncbi:acyl-CoA dehydrogenase family protein [Phenylobacterium sp. J367]|uniref:acyl-CoA dehydrogenase family protein n=1 Tax=Phenylobacterium sp. J367 TaxID=2898435 RepID=UPI0027E33CA8|nr:acyl-CoA dehydrogenase family protein [Phenylobacterium sp. J367]